MMKRRVVALVMMLMLVTALGVADAPPGLPALVLYVTPDQQVLAQETVYFPVGTSTFYANYSIIPDGYTLVGDPFQQVVVTADGNIGYKGCYMRDKVYTIRPAMWGDLAAFIDSQTQPQQQPAG